MQWAVLPLLSLCPKSAFSPAHRPTNGLLCPLGPARMTTGSSRVLAQPDQSEQRESTSQIELLLGPQAGWPIDSSQDLGPKKEHRAKVGLW